MHTKLRNFILDTIELFSGNPNKATIALTCLSINGYDYGKCGNNIISSYTGLSKNTISNTFAQLEKEGFFDKQTGIKRNGKICFSQPFYEKHKDVLNFFDTRDFSIFKAEIITILPEQSKIICKSENGLIINGFVTDYSALVFVAPVGTNIQFKASLLSQFDTEINVWVDSSSIKRDLS